MKIHTKGGFLRLATDEELQRIHAATLQVLEEVGIATDSPRMLRAFADAGGEVDQKENRIRLPSELVEQALAKTPQRIKLYGRNEEKDILLEDGRVYFGLGGCSFPLFMDGPNGKVKRPVKSDVVKSTRLADALANLSFIMVIADSCDARPEVHHLHNLEVMLNNTEKPIICAMPGGKEAERALQMAGALVGGEDQLRERPPISLYSESTSPLFFSTFNDNVMEFAQRGAAVVFGPGPMLGATAPATVAGTLVICNAEILAAVVLCQSINPGTPIIYSPNLSAMDMKTARTTLAAPSVIMTHILGGQMARYYEMPSFIGSCIDSKVCDAQAGAEAMFQCLTSALAGINLIQGIGIMAGCEYASMEMVVICNEIIGMVCRLLEGVNIDNETLAVDVIREVGPGGNFLSHVHTLNHFREELYMPKLFNRLSPDDWIKAGRKDTETVAREKIGDFLAKHSSNSLPHETQQKLGKILKEAEEDLIKES